MYYNPNLFIALPLAAVTFLLGMQLGQKLKNKTIRHAVTAVLVLLCLPALSFILYYAGLFKQSLAYGDFRSIPGIETLSASWGLLGGHLYPCFKPRLTSSLKRLAYFAFCAGFLFIPFAKSILLPVELAGDFRDTWKDNVCMQSGRSSCGPACMATLFKFHRLHLTEQEIAKGCYTCLTGTENWYMIRFARTQGFSVACSEVRDIRNVPTPSLIGTFLPSGAGHFITLLQITPDNTLHIGDPLLGKRVLSPTQFKKEYTFSHFVFHIKK
ncbi:MAG: hypothetical protein GY765_00550 [bacterium]|nr:hypothetical protein [bacterium]